MVIGIAASAPGPWNSSGYQERVLLGLLFCLGGDIALMFQQRRRLFLTGLVLFLAGHIAYTSAFAIHARLSAWTLWSGLALLFVGLVFYRLISTGVESVRIPVILYFLVISLMVAMAASLAGNTQLAGSLGILVLAGALLFYISDVLLAANRFWRPWRYNRISLAFYYGGQLLIALSTHSSISLL